MQKFISVLIVKYHSILNSFRKFWKVPKGKKMYLWKIISTNRALSLGKLHSAKWSVYDSKSCAGWWSESAVKNHECCSTRTKNIKVLENSRKDSAPRFFWETPAHSDTKCFAASATCQSSVASSSSRQSTAMDQLVTQQALSQRQRYHHSFSSWLEMGDDMKDMSPKNDTDSKLNFQKPSGLTLSLIALHPRLKAIWKTKVSNSLSQCVICRVHEYGVKVGWELFPKAFRNPIQVIQIYCRVELFGKIFFCIN